MTSGSGCCVPQLTGDGDLREAPGRTGRQYVEAAEACLYFPSLLRRHPSLLWQACLELPIFIYNEDILCTMDFLHDF